MKDNRHYILIRNGTLVSAESARQEDLLVEDGKIVAAGNFNPDDYPGCEILNAAGKYVIPGGFDPHVHLALPTPAGNSCDDFISGSRAALEGGTTHVMDFVTPRRGQSLAEALRLRRIEAAGSLAGCGLHMGISEWNPAIAAEIIPLMEREGIRSFKAYLAYRETIGISYDDLDELMQIVGPDGGVVMVHCEEGEMISRLQKQFLSEGKTRAAYHALSRPPEAEISAIGKVIGLSAKTGCPAYIVHISTRQGADLVAAAKKEGIRVFGETCPHYLLLDESVYKEKLENMKVMPYVVSPPIRTKADRERLWKGLTDGTFDVVATDHCPFNLSGQKDRGMDDFTKIPNGAGSLEYRMGLLYTYGVLTGRITLSQFVSLVSVRPAEIFGMGHRKGKLLPGYDADIVIWDPQYQAEISAASSIQRCDSNIYEGFNIQGKAETVILNGKIINRNWLRRAPLRSGS
ncbi:MAG: dihydropyrimidinase [Bacteroidales bacterium]